jgi:CDP-diacylglycerol--glycerol-3-phosphate 3-phosphatidyltransferase
VLRTFGFHPTAIGRLSAHYNKVVPDPTPQHQLQVSSTPGLWPPTWPMGLTMLRLLLLPVFLYLLLLDAGPDVGGRVNPHRWWAMGVFALMALTDKLDGYLARRLNQTSKLGTVLDPVADKLLIASSVVLLSFDWAAGASYRIPLPVVIAVYGKDVVVVLGTVGLLALVGRVSVTPRWLGKAGTFFQLLLVMLTLVAPDLDRLWPGSGRGVLRALWWTVGAVSVASAVDYVLVGVRQLREARTEVRGAEEERHEGT